jgi:ketosteroid isomerase-like protein
MENLIPEDDFVAAQTAGSAETHDGNPYNNTYCQVMRVHDEKIAAVKEYFDTKLTTAVFESA